MQGAVGIYLSPLLRFMARVPILLWWEEGALKIGPGGQHSLDDKYRTTQYDTGTRLCRSRWGWGKKGRKGKRPAGRTSTAPPRANLVFFSFFFFFSFVSDPG